MIDRAFALRQLDSVQAAVDALRQTLTARTATLTPGQSIQAALDDPDVDTVVLADGTYDGALTIARPVTLRPATVLPPGALVPGTALPVTLTSMAPTTVAIPGSLAVMTGGIAVRNGVPASTLIDVTGAGTVLDRVAALGDPARGQHRGIAVNGTDTQIVGCWVDDCWLPGRDAQAVCGWSGTKNLLIDRSFLAGGAETVMFGGADSSSPEQIPTGIRITNTVMTKRPAWVGLKAQLKCAFEVKSARDVTVSDCVLEYAGVAEGQSGFLCVLTVRNQSGKAPWSTIERVRMERITGRYAGGGVSLMGTDSNFPSGTLTDVTLRDWILTDMDPLDPGLFPGSYKGSGRLIQVQRGPVGVTIERWRATEQMRNMRAGVYVMGAPPVGLVLRDVALPACPYPIKIDNGGAGRAALIAYAPDAVLDAVTAGGVAV